MCLTGRPSIWRPDLFMDPSLGCGVGGSAARVKIAWSQGVLCGGPLCWSRSMWNRGWGRGMGTPVVWVLPYWSRGSVYFGWFLTGVVWYAPWPSALWVIPGQKWHRGQKSRGSHIDGCVEFSQGSLNHMWIQVLHACVNSGGLGAVSP